MSRKRLGAIDSESVRDLRETAESGARDRRSQMVGKAPPIAQVAGAAGRSIEDEILRLRLENRDLKVKGTILDEADSQGLLIQPIKLSDIDPFAMSRDRRVVSREDDAWQELKDSLRMRGQQVPVEVLRTEGTAHKFALISGLRRWSALAELFEETGEDRFDTILAIVRSARPLVDSMIAMVEENEIRQGISFYERARICCLATEQGVANSVDESIDVLFASSNRNRRYKIRNFTVIHTEIGTLLDYPEHIGERLGARLAQALKDGRGRELRRVLSERGQKFESAQSELEVLERFVARSGEFGQVRPTNAPAISAELTTPGGVRLLGQVRRGRVSLIVEGLDVADETQLAALLRRIGATSLES